MLQVENKIISNKRIKEKYFHCVISSPEIANCALPGQFINIKVTDKSEPLLRRPLSIHRVKGKNIELFYEVVGDATEILSQKKPGQYLDVIGPLGNGFNVTTSVRSEAKPPRRGQRQCEAKRSLPEGDNVTTEILVAGGMGVAPLVFLAERLVTSYKLQVTSKPLILLGAITKTGILCEKEFKKIGCNVKIATDDGSSGFKGRVTDLLKQRLSTIDYRLSTIYACGPHPMLKAIAVISQEYKIPAQVSLEEHMACGIGACLGCVVETFGGLKRVCKEGPVFNAKDIIW